MDSFEWNKVIAAFLVAFIAAMVFGLVGDWAIDPKRVLEKNVLVVELKDVKPDTGSEEKEKVLEPITPLLVKASIENGEKVFKKCAQCHNIAKGQPHTQGPNLFGLIGRQIASIADYAYSSAFKEKGHITWDVENINHFIYKPRAFVKGTKMSFAGIESDSDRADLIAYLQAKAH